MGRKHKHIPHKYGRYRGQDSVQQSASDVKAEDATGTELNADLSERLNPRSSSVYEKAILPRLRDNLRGSNYIVKLNPKVRSYLESEQKVVRDFTNEKWITASEIPSNEEVNLDANVEVKLPSNRTERPYKSIAKYLRTQYSLLREDAVSPLRDALDQYKQNPDMQENQAANIYEKVHIIRLTYTQNGIAARVKFSTARTGKRIQWSSSKRLISGSIVALSQSSDDFRTHCIIATVAARPLNLINESPPQIDIYFSRPEEAEIDPQKEFVMVEAKSGYFEAHRYTLKALQKLSAESFPLSANIVHTSADIETPDYVLKHPYMDLSIIERTSTANILRRVQVLNDWPLSAATHTIDSTQLDALQQILTQSLAIIQGPPGTGKTHVSIIALRVLLQHRNPGDPPIIVAAQTNHALDQLLELLDDFEPDYIRLGGRSTSSQVKKRALYAVREQERINNVPGSGLVRSRTRMDALRSQFKQLLQIYNRESGPISTELFHLLGVLTEKQQASLEDAATDWISAESLEMNAMQLWLHKTILRFQTIYPEEQYGYEEAEEDLEQEQVKECEAEHGVTDEEDIEMLRGPWQDLTDEWTVVQPSSADLTKAEQLLDTCDDLWNDVPEYLRGAVYWHMRQRATAKLLSQFRDIATEYDRLVHEIKIGRWEKDAVYLSNATIIGMTTTGLSKYRALIASLEPKIILIEEAAEIIEAPVTVACMESVRHLILVGDHLQLRGHCAVQELEGPDYNLNVSMFERLVKMGIPFKTLLKQRRMIPEFRALISSIYPKLVDHPDVLTRNPPDWGTGQTRSFFFTHPWLEAKDETLSTYNEQESVMVTKFYRHLLNNGVPPGAITILTFYNGHRKKLLKEIRNDPVTNAAYANVKTVDSYQGKEASIIILSLARNNVHQSIGFLNNANRVCVALSRARDGLYIFGNAEIVYSDPVWHEVIDQMMAAKRVNNKFAIHCSKHNRTTHLRYPSEWDAKAPEGGCHQICKDLLPCGHICDSVCHGYEHDVMLCHQPCKKTMPCGHACKKQCHERCACNCPEYDRLAIAALHAQHETASAEPKSKPQNLHGAADTHDSQNLVRSAGQGRNRFVQDFEYGAAADTKTSDYVSSEQIKEICQQYRGYRFTRLTGTSNSRYVCK